MPGQGRCDDPANALLAWYVNGSLEEKELAGVEDHLKGCSRCAGEIAMLATVARGVQEHGVPIPDREPVAAGYRSRRLAYGLAAGLLVPALLGIYWIFLGLPRESRVVESTVMIELGGGTLRGTDQKPALAIPDGAKWVTILFRFESDPSARYAVELVNPDGRILGRLEGLPPSDSVGTRAFSLPVNAVAARGDYELVVSEWGADPDPRRFRFAFAVSATEAD